MDVLELLNKEEVGYTPSGQDYLIRCLNPEHDDSNPSLRVDKVTGVMHCFSCGFRGNVFAHFDAPGISPKELKRKKVKEKIEVYLKGEIQKNDLFILLLLNLFVI